MARNTDTIDYKEDYYRGFSKIYFNRILEKIIEFGDLRNEPGSILDFGCGVGHLKEKLASRKVVGYDIIPELSDVSDWRDLTPNQIVMSGVLEHLYGQEIEVLIDELKSKNPRANLLVYLPTENWISKIAMRLAGQKNAHDDHVSKYQEVNRIIEKSYNLDKRCYLFLGMAQITRYVPR
ncbi:MAG TPA: methyltransferase domain-containing protein [Candidatus Portnoybacteria bacterium]|nr:methyltransferase domain-containing protein [Candidatus Portnoybacteria bacterium]